MTVEQTVEQTKNKQIIYEIFISKIYKYKRLYIYIFKISQINKSEYIWVIKYNSFKHIQRKDVYFICFII